MHGRLYGVSMLCRTFKGREHLRGRLRGGDDQH